MSSTPKSEQAAKKCSVRQIDSVPFDKTVFLIAFETLSTFADINPFFPLFTIKIIPLFTLPLLIETVTSSFENNPLPFKLII